MKLGLIGPHDGGEPRVGCPELQSQLNLASSLGFDQVYFSGMRPDDLATLPIDQTTQIKIGMDARAFGPCPPSEIERVVLKTQDRLGCRLALGLKMYGAGASSTQLTKAQAFDTLFSQDPRTELTFGAQRYPIKPQCPDVIGLPVTGACEDVAIAAARGYYAMSPSWLPAPQLARHWPAIVQGATSALRRARRAYWQVARMIVVHEDAATLDAYIYGTNSPFRRYYTYLSICGLIGSDVDAHLRRVVIAGSASKVADTILKLRETAGAFGSLQIVNPAGNDPTMTRGTMIRLAEQVRPLVAAAGLENFKELETP